MERLPVLPVLAVVLISAACMRAPTTPPDRRAIEVRDIRDFETAWNRDFSRSDVERLVSRYTPDATLLLPNLPAVTGGEAIRDTWKSAVQDGNFSMRLDNTRVEVARDGDLAYSQGSYTATLTDPVSGKRLRDTGAYVVVYRKVAADVWKVVADIHTRGAAPVEEE